MKQMNLSTYFRIILSLKVQNSILVRISLDTTKIHFVYLLSSPILITTLHIFLVSTSVTLSSSRKYQKNKARDPVEITRLRVDVRRTHIGKITFVDIFIEPLKGC